MAPRRFRLSIVGPTEDQPRLLRTYGRTRAGEIALVLRPGIAKGLLVWIPKQGETVVWRTGPHSSSEAPRPTAERTPAIVLRDGPTKLRLEAGPWAGTLLTAEELPASLSHGQQLQVELSANGSLKRVVLPGLEGDAPQPPTEPMAPKAAIHLVRLAQRCIPRDGPITLRGRWSGALLWGEGPPQLELKRGLAAYGTLWVRSHGPAGWSWAFERSERWFSEPTENGGSGLSTLAEAMQAGVLGAMRLVREACSHRDTHRRAAFDPDYAKKHPVFAPPPGPDPLSPLKPPTARRRGRALPPKAMSEGPTPLTPEGPEEAQQRAKRLQQQARDLEAPTTGWSQESDPVEFAAWFAAQGHPQLAEAILAHLEGTDEPVETLIARLRELGPGLSDEATRKLEDLQQALRSTPATLERARKLLRHAQALANAPSCQGPDQEAALEAIARGTEVYQEARTALLEAKPWDARRTLRRIAEEVSLAARAARSCAKTRPEPPKRRVPKKQRSRKRSTATPEASKADPDKDQALLEAFQTAIASALGGSPSP